MSIAIDNEKCVGCMRCSQVCPGSLIYESGGKAVMKYPDLCWGCTSCLKECKFSAISFFLGADIGGMGGRMKIKKQGDILYWNIEKLDGTVVTIEVNSKNSNEY